MKQEWSWLILVLIAAGLVAAGCGKSTAQKAQDQAVSQCLSQAQRLPADARKTAEAACNAAKAGNSAAVKGAERRQCLDAAKKISASAARRQAKAACKTATK